VLNHRCGPEPALTEAGYAQESALEQGNASRSASSSYPELAVFDCRGGAYDATFPIGEWKDLRADLVEKRAKKLKHRHGSF